MSALGVRGSGDGGLCWGVLMGLTWLFYCHFRDWYWLAGCFDKAFSMVSGSWVEIVLEMF